MNTKENSNIDTIKDEEVLFISDTITICNDKDKTDNLQTSKIIDNLCKRSIALSIKMVDIINYAQINKISIHEAMFEFLKNGTLLLQDIFDLAGMFICEMRDNN